MVLMCTTEVSTASIMIPSLMFWPVEPESTLSKFADNTKQGAVPEGYAAFKRDLDRVEIWSDSKLMKLNRKCSAASLEEQPDEPVCAEN